MHGRRLFLMVAAPRGQEVAFDPSMTAAGSCAFATVRSPSFTNALAPAHPHRTAPAPARRPPEAEPRREPRQLSCGRWRGCGRTRPQASWKTAGPTAPGVPRCSGPRFPTPPTGLLLELRTTDLAPKACVAVHYPPPRCRPRRTRDGVGHCYPCPPTKVLPISPTGADLARVSLRRLASADFAVSLCGLWPVACGLWVVRAPCSGPRTDAG